MSSAPPRATLGRDVRLDLLRGAFVALMIFGHLGWRELVPHFRIGFATLAEGFFALSGATLGVVAARRVATGRAQEMARHLLWRGLWLYGANLVLVAAARTLEGTRPYPAGYFRLYWRNTPELWTWLSFDQPSVLNVLPRYALFLVLAPLALFALRRGARTALLATSIALWAVDFLSQGALRLPGFEGERAPYPSASWQLVFFVPMALAYPPPARAEGTAGSWLDRGALVATALAAVLAAELLMRDPGPAAFGPWASRPLLGPLRLISLLAGALLLRWLVTRHRTRVEAWTGWLLVPYGRAALPAFLLHAPVVWAFLAIPPFDTRAGLRKLAAAAVVLALLPLLKVPAVRRWLTP
ncbi:MAG: hypothetical protein F9K18_10545 [Thermoanaerobaculia bacterium]|nr:MAG: hypothetical protein F9K18_10545 [Thermoanaerobaculia bacterium]